MSRDSHCHLQAEQYGGFQPTRTPLCERILTRRRPLRSTHQPGTITRVTMRANPHIVTPATCQAPARDHGTGHCASQSSHNDAQRHSLEGIGAHQPASCEPILTKSRLKPLKSGWHNSDDPSRPASVQSRMSGHTRDGGPANRAGVSGIWRLARPVIYVTSQLPGIPAASTHIHQLTYARTYAR